MASRMGTDEEMGQNKSSGWMLDQKLDQPMDEEAMRLKNMSTEKVSLHFSFGVNLNIRYSCPCDFTLLYIVYVCETPYCYDL